MKLLKNFEIKYCDSSGYDIVYINIKNLDAELKNEIDKYIMKIWQGNEISKLQIVKKEILNFISSKKNRNKKIGAIAEFFIHFYLNLYEYKQEGLFRNLEEGSFKKGFDGYYSKDGETWIVESKSTALSNKKHYQKINEAYNDILQKISLASSNNPWRNAYNHAINKNVDTSNDIVECLKSLSDDFVMNVEHNIREFNIIPCSTIYLTYKENCECEEDLFCSIHNIVEGFEYKNIVIVCINNYAEKLFVEYLKE